MTQKSEAIEKYFLSIGRCEDWKHHHTGEKVNVFIGDDGDWYYVFPDIIDHYPSFKKWVLERMEGEQIHPVISLGRWFWVPSMDGLLVEDIKDNEITLYAVIAATRYFESVKEKG